MPVSYQIERGLLMLDVSGVHPAMDVIAALRQAAEDPLLVRPARALIDARETENSRSRGEVRVMADETASLPGFSRARIAILVRGDLHFGLARMAAAFVDEHGPEIRAFREEEPALCWLAEGPRRVV